MSYDIIIIGAGSVGLPLAYYLAKEKVKVLVIEKELSPGQGSNKSAIGGVRASHSEPVKVIAANESIRIIHELEKEGYDFETKKGGYLYVAKSENDFLSLKKSHSTLEKHGIRSSLLKPIELKDIVKEIHWENYYGGLYSPDDIDISPLSSCVNFYLLAKKYGAEFLFQEKVSDFKIKHNRINRVITNKGEYQGGLIVLANGAEIRETGNLLHLDIPVFPDSHEAGISAPYAPILEPMIVDISPDEDHVSRNFYFTQNKVGAFIFCYTPYDSIYGEFATSTFMKVISKRMINTIPSLKNIYIRRTWRGYYPMTPDGVPIMEKINQFDNLALFGGMCGQGVMLGPGLAKFFAKILLYQENLFPGDVYSSLSFTRNYSSSELLK